jgi:hypothetical protein
MASAKLMKVRVTTAYNVALGRLGCALDLAEVRNEVLTARGELNQPSKRELMKHIDALDVCIADGLRLFGADARARKHIFRSMRKIVQPSVNAYAQLLNVDLKEIQGFVEVVFHHYEEASQQADFLDGVRKPMLLSERIADGMHSGTIGNPLSSAVFAAGRLLMRDWKTFALALLLAVNFYIILETLMIANTAYCADVVVMKANPAYSKPAPEPEPEPELPKLPEVPQGPYDAVANAVAAFGELAYARAAAAISDKFFENVATTAVKIAADEIALQNPESVPAYIAASVADEISGAIGHYTRLPDTCQGIHLYAHTLWYASSGATAVNTALLGVAGVGFFTTFAYAIRHGLFGAPLTVRPASSSEVDTDLRPIDLEDADDIDESEKKNRGASESRIVRRPNGFRISTNSTQLSSCATCSKAAESRCSACKTVYCSQNCQRISWNAGHNVLCGIYVRMNE